jgi:hypothetical protein
VKNRASRGQLPEFGLYHEKGGPQKGKFSNRLEYLIIPRGKGSKITL